MKDMDDIFALLRDEPVSDRLAGLDEAVLSGLARQRDRMAGRQGMILACAVAAFVGLWGGLALPVSLTGRGGHANADPVLGLPAAAPSHLLAF